MVGQPVGDTPDKLTYIGRTSDNIDILIVRYPKFENNIYSAYPYYD